MNLALHSIQFAEALDICICVDDSFSDKLDTVVEPISNIKVLAKYNSYLKFKEAFSYVSFDCIVISRKVALMDLYDFIDFTVEIHKKGVSIIFIGDDMDSLTLKMLIKARINSLVYEADSFVNILKAIRDATQKEFFVSSNYLKVLLGFFWTQTDLSITAKEVAVLNGVKSGLKYSEIAEELSMSQETVRVHLKKIYKKLSVENKSQALVKALELNLI